MTKATGKKQTQGDFFVVEKLTGEAVCMEENVIGGDRRGKDDQMAHERQELLSLLFRGMDGVGNDLSEDGGKIIF